MGLTQDRLGKVDNPIHIDGVYSTTNEGVINWVPEDTENSDEICKMIKLIKGTL